MQKKTTTAHDYKEIYDGLGLDLKTLGCVMLDLEPIPNTYGLDKALYTSPDKAKFWIKGWVGGDAHVTMLYGLLNTAKNYEQQIKKLLADWKLDGVKIADVGYFDSPYADEPYYCIIAHIEPTPELVEGHQRLEFLPHVNTHMGYNPHITLAYIKKDQGESYRDQSIKALSAALKGKEIKVKPELNLGGNK